MRSLKVLATSAVVAAGLVFAGGTAAHAATEYDVYWTHAEVEEKAGVLGAITFACNFAPAVVSVGCSGGDAGTVFDYAALKDCAVKQHVVITGSSMSYDRSVSTYYPYDCRNPNG